MFKHREHRKMFKFLFLTLNRVKIKHKRKKIEAIIDCMLDCGGRGNTLGIPYQLKKGVWERERS